MNKYGILNQGKLESGHAGKNCFGKVLICSIL